MTIPSLIFAFLIASLYGALYHLVRGGRLGRLLLFLMLGWTGFVLGHLLGLWQGWLLFPLGELNFGLSSISSLIFLVAGDWISQIRVRSETFSDGQNGV